LLDQQRAGQPQERGVDGDPEHVGPSADLAVDALESLPSRTISPAQLRSRPVDQVPMRLIAGHLRVLVARASDSPGVRARLVACALVPCRRITLASWSVMLSAALQECGVRYDQECGIRYHMAGSLSMPDHTQFAHQGSNRDSVQGCF
jgi:hypothetical protein